MPYSVLNFTLDQAVANTTIQTEISTGLGASNTVGMNVIAMEFEFLKDIAVGELSVVMVGTNEVAAVVNDPDMIFRVSEWNSNQGVVLQPIFNERITVRPSLFISLESYTVQLQKLRGRIYYELVTLKEIDYLRLLSAGA